MRFSFAGLWFTLAAACTPASQAPAPTASHCAAVALTADTLALVQATPKLVGEYRLVAVVDTGTAVGRAGRAQLGLWLADDGRVLGATTLDLHALQAPNMSNLASRSDSRPGLTLAGRRLALVPIDGQPYIPTEFVVEHISPTGFAGRWSAHAGRFVEGLHGVPLEDAAGHFCAERQ